jgi:prepilin-type N-terminal cleavage/methylation domain-containing protein
MLTRLLRMMRCKRAPSAPVPVGEAGRQGSGSRGTECGTHILRNQRGFTLIELLVSVLVMTVSIFGVIGMQTMALQANTIAHQLTTGSALAQQMLEDILAFPLDNRTVNTTNVSTSAPYNYGGYNLGSTQDGGFPLSLTVVPPTYSQTMTDPNGGSYTATYTTLVGTAANGVPVGVSRITVTVNYSYRKIQKRVTMTGFKRTT